MSTAKAPSLAGALLWVGLPAAALGYVLLRNKSSGPFLLKAGGEVAWKAPSDGYQTINLPPAAQWVSAFVRDGASGLLRAAVIPATAGTPITIAASAGNQIVVTWTDSTGGVQLTTIVLS